MSSINARMNADENGGVGADAGGVDAREREPSLILSTYSRTDESAGSPRNARLLSGNGAETNRQTAIVASYSVASSLSNGDKRATHDDEQNCENEQDVQMAESHRGDEVKRPLSVGIFGSCMDDAEDDRFISSPPKVQRELDRSPSLAFLRPRRRCLLRTSPQAPSQRGLSLCSVDSISRKRRVHEINVPPVSSAAPPKGDSTPKIHLPHVDAPSTPAPTADTATPDEGRSIASISPVLCPSPATRIESLHLSLRSPVVAPASPLAVLHTPGSNQGVSSFTVYSKAKNGGGDTTSGGISYRTPCSSTRSSPRQVPLTVLSNIGSPSTETRARSNSGLLRSPFLLSLDAPCREGNSQDEDQEDSVHRRIGRTSKPTADTEGLRPPLFPRCSRGESQFQASAVVPSPAHGKHIPFHCHSESNPPTSPKGLDERDMLFVRSTAPVTRADSKPFATESPRGEPPWNAPVAEVIGFKASSVLTTSRASSAGLRSILHMEIDGGHGTDGTLSESGDEAEEEEDDDTFFLTPPSAVASARLVAAETAAIPSRQDSRRSAEHGRGGRSASDGGTSNGDDEAISPFEPLKIRNAKESPCFTDSTGTPATLEQPSTMSTATTVHSSTVSTCASIGRSSSTPSGGFDRKLSEQSLASLGMNVDCISCSSDDDVRKSVPLRDLTTPPGQMFPIRESGVSSLNPPPLRQNDMHHSNQELSSDASRICEKAVTSNGLGRAWSKEFGSTVVTCVVKADRTSVLNAIKQMDDAANMSKQAKAARGDGSKHLSGDLLECMHRR